MSGERIEAHSSLIICRVLTSVILDAKVDCSVDYIIILFHSVPFHVVSSVVVSMESFHVHSVMLFNHFVFGLSIFLLIV